MERKISLAYLTVPGITPVDEIRMAAELGYDYTSIRTIPMGQPGEPQVCLEKDPEMFKEIRQTLKDCNMKLLDIELVRVREDLPLDYRKAFECGAELGATEILSSVWTENRNFAVEAYGKICEQAAEFGMNVNFEFPIVSGVKTLKEAAEIQDQVRAKNLKLLMDMIYCHWDQVTPEIIESYGKDRFGLIHLCDCPNIWKATELVKVVREGREYCGLGEANLKALLKALPENPCSIELPNKKYIEQYGAKGHAENCLKYARKLFAELDLPDLQQTA